MSPEVRKDIPPYKMPERVASATIHFLYGFSQPGSFDSVADYFKERKYALTADLLSEGFTGEQIEEAVNSGVVNAAPLFNARTTDFYWTYEAAEELNRLADTVQQQCGGDGTDMNAPVGGDILSLGGIFESQQTALAALAYASHKGLIVETPIDRGVGVGPMFVSKNSPLASLLGQQPK